MVPKSLLTKFKHRLSTLLLVAPYTLVFVVFFLIPLVIVVMVSFWDYTEYSIIPDFITTNYTDIFHGCGTKLPDDVTVESPEPSMCTKPAKTAL